MSRRTILVLAAFVVAAVVALGVARWQDGSGPADRDPSRVSAEEARDLAEEGAVVVDVRTPEEYAAGHLEGARNLPAEVGDFDELAAGLDRDATYVVYCETGRRAALAVARMRDLGFSDLHNAGGIDDLADVVAPVVTPG